MFCFVNFNTVCNAIHFYFHSFFLYIAFIFIWPLVYATIILSFIIITILLLLRLCTQFEFSLSGIAIISGSPFHCILFYVIDFCISNVCLIIFLHFNLFVCFIRTQCKKKLSVCEFTQIYLLENYHHLILMTNGIICFVLFFAFEITFINMFCVRRIVAVGVVVVLTAQLIL